MTMHTTGGNDDNNNSNVTATTTTSVENSQPDDGANRESVNEEIMSLLNASDNDGNTFLSVIASATGKSSSGNNTTSNQSKHFQVTTFGRDTIDNEANYFINIALEVLRKHFLYWTEDLLYYMIGTEKEPARKFCCWLLELDHSNIKRYHSKEHSQHIDHEDLFSFLLPPDNQKRNEALRHQINDKLHMHKSAIRKIALGEESVFERFIRRGYFDFAKVDSAVYCCPWNPYSPC